MTVDVEITRSVDGPELAALVGGEYRDGHLLVEAADPLTVTHALEAWVAERGLPLVPVQIGEGAFALAPPVA